MMPRRALWFWVITGLGSTGLLGVALFGVVVAVLGASFGGCEPPPEPHSGRPGRRLLRTRSRVSRPNGCVSTSRPARSTTSTGASSPRSVRRSAGTASAPARTPQAAPARCKSPSSGAANAAPGPARRCGNATGSPHTPVAHRTSTIRPTRSTPRRESFAKPKGAPATGGSFAEYRQAACNYYGACADATVSYAEEVMARAVQYGFLGSGAPAPTDPSLAEPVSTGGCEASVFSPEAASSSQIVKVAESQLGQSEHPPGSECTAYGPCEEWCSLFASWVWKKAGVPLPGSTAVYGYSGSLYTWAKENAGRYSPRPRCPRLGTLVFYGTGPGPGERDHVGVVRARIPRRANQHDRGNDEGRVEPRRAVPAVEPDREEAAVYGYAQPPAPKAARQ